MASFKSYTHVERLDKVECDGLLNNPRVHITAKVDATNALVYYNTETNKVCAGSRTRELSEAKDNAGFCEWVINSYNEEAVFLRNFVTQFPHLIVYGEWMGANKFVGAIKDYNPNAIGHMFIFDVFDTETLTYMVDEKWRPFLIEEGAKEEWFVPILATLDYPTVDQVREIAENNKFLLDNSPRKGEGVVCKVGGAGFRNAWGNHVYGKLVLDEYRQDKAKPKVKKEYAEGEVEDEIVDRYLTDAELGKNVAKVCVLLDKEEFDNKNGQMIGRFLNLCYADSVLGEMADICKRLKNPVVNFAVLQHKVYEKARKYVGLV